MALAYAKGLHSRGVGGRLLIFAFEIWGTYFREGLSRGDFFGGYGEKLSELSEMFTLLSTIRTCKYYHLSIYFLIFLNNLTLSCNPQGDITVGISVETFSG